MNVLERLCEILFIKAKKVLLSIILIRENLICVYFQHTIYICDYVQIVC